MNSTMNTRNSTFAMVAAVPAITPKPSTPAIRAMTRKTMA
jgi:hypothetical protein